ncbi:hypothetical protein DM01DRAFT_1348637 [Hesseltinella vesiculosa]|uniref:Uncharacterized protein n=1 Tax=Hesseltinella vesiculosa TaxID=101127 RepID=A0A1X2G874_9FUNG|nr:hypothetical protein DM01DRAFT_1348637 [Hesseltinella vesiculosa]
MAAMFGLSLKVANKIPLCDTLKAKPNGLIAHHDFGDTDAKLDLVKPVSPIANQPTTTGDNAPSVNSADDLHENDSHGSSSTEMETESFFYGNIYQLSVRNLSFSKELYGQGQKNWHSLHDWRCQIYNIGMKAHHWNRLLAEIDAISLDQCESLLPEYVTVFDQLLGIGDKTKK